MNPLNVPWDSSTLKPFSLADAAERVGAGFPQESVAAFVAEHGNFAPAKTWIVTPEQDLQRHRCSVGEHEKDDTLEKREAVRDAMGGDDRFKVCRHCKSVFWYG